ncbi:MAG: CDP-diacylglycerol--glycerol-3-phosphate 3-phosphatidyltransferase [Candidatus Omnitrophica bacterium]|nr:CDP-diacylglycerol--glycerol-3-phosphate 3-phosphatidyltransferase [Candidatus Omnitrophota bacterium]MCM8826121.1 CDP-diacylglycerol--glycerol-3-phosphate 3-phosphatidyltransferase [Candidatus Omnitrophota bacterium]
MNVSNCLTISRIIIAFFCIGLIIKNNLISLSVSFLLFLIASFTDFLDGFIARKKNKISDLGKLLDPIADKILVLGIFLSFLVVKIINVWMVIVIMIREFIITGLRLLALNRGYVLEAKKAGKHKTLSQMLGINFIFVILILKKIFTQNKLIDFLYQTVIPLFMWYIVIITAFSGLQYLWINRKIIRDF